MLAHGEGDGAVDQSGKVKRLNRRPCISSGMGCIAGGMERGRGGVGEVNEGQRKSPSE